MPKQPACLGLHDSIKIRLTRCEKFLLETDALVPWHRMPELIAPQYPKADAKSRRLYMPLETMLRVCARKNWCALGYTMAEGMLDDSSAIRRLAGIEVGGRT